jgi:hypothetical protein
MSAGGKAGVVGELVKSASAMHADAARAAEGEQIAMFAVPTRHTGNRKDSLQRGLEERHRDPGRPAGSQNAMTAKFREYLLARGVNPLEQMMRWSMHTPVSLATELKCTPYEAFLVLRDLWKELAPYFAARLAPVDGKGNAVPATFMMVAGGGVVGAGDPNFRPWDYMKTVEAAPQETQQNQPLPEPAYAVSHDAVSHKEAK